MESAGLLPPYKSKDLSFQIIPKINAPGRIGDAKVALNLCLTSSDAEAKTLLKEIEANNIQRQMETAKAIEEAEIEVQQIKDDAPAIVIKSKNWSPGIVGLVAAQLAEKYNKPTFIVSASESRLRGSARSANGVHIVNVLKSASTHLASYGGHLAAGGFTLYSKHFDQFKEAVIENVNNQIVNLQNRKVQQIDALISLQDINDQLYSQIETMEPFGLGNDEPVFASMGIKVIDNKIFGKDGNHLRLKIQSMDGTVANAIWWNGAKEVSRLTYAQPINGVTKSRRIDICYTLEKVKEAGRSMIILNIKDVRPTRNFEMRQRTLQEGSKPNTQGLGL